MEAPADKRAEDLFFCPVCGQKHRGDLSTLRNGGAALKAPCAGCKRPLVVTWADGGPLVKIVGAEPGNVGRGVAAPLDPDRTRESPLRLATPDPATMPSVASVAASAAAAAAKTSAPKAAAAKPAAKPEKREERSPRPAPPARRAKQPEKAPAEPEEPPIEAEFKAGTRVGRYTLEEAIGSGGTGTVYRAFDPTTNRYVALKFLAQGLSDSMRERFLREIEVQANLRHPHLMPVFDRGEHEGRPYFTMELLYRPFTLTEIVKMNRDGTLSRYATLRPFAELSALVKQVFIPVCDAIHVANVENGVVHRDLKPDNVLVDSRTLRPYVIDFGICHVLERKARFTSTVLAPTAEDAGIVGTPRFLAPEQARGTVHERTDVWGLGAILHFCVSGEPPIAAAAQISRRELERRILALREAEAAARAAGDERKADLCEEKLARLEDIGLRTMDDLFLDAREGHYTPLPGDAPPAVAAVVAKAMAPKTADRYVSARSLGADLSAWLEGAQTRAMAERGSSAASVVKDAGRAVKRHLSTALVLAAGVVGGFLLAPAFGAGGGTRTATSSVGGVFDGIAALDREAGNAAQRASMLSIPEAQRLHDLLADRVATLRSRLRDLPRAESQDAARALDAVADRMRPALVRVVGAGSAGTKATDLLRGGEPIEAKDGELTLPPGAYAVQVGSRVRLPLRVPFVWRESGKPADREPPTLTVSVPVAPDSVPTSMVLVAPAPAAVEFRGPPYTASPPLPIDVAPFLIDRVETTNKEWLEFLESLPDAERAKRVPAVRFKADASKAGHFKPTDDSPDNPELPVAGVSPEDVLAYVAWRAKKEGTKLRLPTEAEWAAAAGVGLGWWLPSGWQDAPSDADFDPVVRSVHKVPERLEPFGVAGLLGNVREIVTAVRTPAGKVEFLVKGGAAGDAPADAGIRRVTPIAADARDPRVGFRCARDAK
jgi:serine/threonine protein kinase/formylglycine-generating enzyme required for sulfatase activity